MGNILKYFNRNVEEKEEDYKDARGYKAPGDSDPLMTNQDGPAEKFQMVEEDKFQMWIKPLQPSDVLEFCTNFDQDTVPPTEKLKQVQSTTIVHSLDVESQVLEVTRKATSWTSFFQKQRFYEVEKKWYPEKMNHFHITHDWGNGLQGSRWQLTGRSDRKRYRFYVYDHGVKDLECKKSGKLWTKLWKPKMKVDDLYKFAGHVPVHEMNPLIY
jgi:hypothetical protein